jgi:transcriptional regulator with XRE-family HTH domain
MPQALPYTLKPESVTVAMFDERGFPKFEVVQASHPTFSRLVRALKRKEWARVPKLISLAQMIADKSQGAVEVKKEGIYYKGVLIDNSLTKRILQIMKEGKPISAMLKFMDNLYQNPESFAIHELYDWLAGCNLPITDDGCFMAYKRVRSDYKDCYTGTIDNSVGQIVFIPRTAVCKDRQQTCAYGLHFCSIAYLPNYPGDKIMQVKINPKDVVSIPVDYDYSKGRTWMYEVVKEIPESQLTLLFDQKIDIEDFQCSVYSIAKDRRKLLASIFELPAIKSMIRHQAKMKARRVKRGRKAKTEKFILSAQSIRKMTYGRLVKLYKQFAPPETPTLTNLTENRLEAIRKSYGFSRGEVASKLDVSYGAVYGMERAKVLAQDVIDKYIAAIIALSKLGAARSTGISFPKPTVKVKAAAAAAYSAPVEPAGLNDAFEDDDDDEPEYDDGFGDFDEEFEDEDRW